MRSPYNRHILAIVLIPFSLFTIPLIALTSQSGPIGAVDDINSKSTVPSSSELADSLREGNNLTSANPTVNDTNYYFSKDRHEISTPGNNTHTGDFGKGTD